MLAGALALAIVGVATTARAASDAYRGEIAGDDKARVELVVERHGSKRVATEFTVRRFALECEDGTNARLQRATIDGTARVSSKGRFEMNASNDSQRLQVAGRLAGAGNAAGQLKYSGMTEFEDATRDCRTGRLRWTAER
jgi:hypothetical protein